MVHGGEGEVIVKEFPKLSGEGGCELWASIRDDLVVKSEAKVNFVEKKSSYPFSGDGLLCRAENYLLCKAMVNHDQQGVKTQGNREVGD